MSVRPAGWWIVIIDGRLVAGFADRDVARAVVGVVSFRTSYSISFKQPEGA